MLQVQACVPGHAPFFLPCTLPSARSLSYPLALLLGQMFARRTHTF